MHVLAICCLSLLAADEVSVKPLNGEAVRGTLVALSESSVEVQTLGGRVAWDAKAIQSLKPAPADGENRSDKSPTPLAILLVDESVLSGKEFTLEAAGVRLELPVGDLLQFPAQLVRGVKFRKQDEALQRQWDEIAASNASADRLVVRRSSAEGADAATTTVILDQLEGIVHGVDARAVSFEYEGDKLQVPLEKVEGILFRHRPSGNLPDPVCRLRDSLGGEWQAKELRLNNGQISVVTVAGVRGRIPWQQVVEIDFSRGNVTYLSDLKAESVDWRPYLSTAVTPPALAKWFAMRHDKAIDGSVLTLAGQSFEKGLCIHSRTLITYRLTKEYRRMQAVVGIDERFRGPGNLKLIISGDSRTLLDRDVRGNDPPFEMDLDISGIRRLKVLVDFGEDRSDAGDHLLLGNARLTK